MKIGFDARMVDHPGIGRYITSILPEIIKLCPGDGFFIYGNVDRINELFPYENVTAIRWERALYSPFEQIMPPFKDIDVLHVPHYNVPVLYKGKMVVTVHDLIHILFPQYNKYFFVKQAASFLLGKALKKASIIISVSDNTRNDLVKMFGAGYEDKIKVVYEAANPVFGEIRDKSVTNPIRAKYGLGENVILYVGSVRPHKNVDTLIKAFNLVKKRNANCQLVISGKWERLELLKSNVDGKSIIYTGEVDIKELVALYNIADLSVTLSSYEGFGLTILESMRCGTPVAVFKNPTSTEVAGDAAFLITSRNVEEVAESLYNVLFDKGLREKLSALGIERAKEFSWVKAAKSTMDIYRSI